MLLGHRSGCRGSMPDAMDLAVRTWERIGLPADIGAHQGVVPIGPDSVHPCMRSVQRDATVLLAARGLHGRHDPVWFMRQAGRSLPEYRAVRGEGRSSRPSSDRPGRRDHAPASAPLRRRRRRAVQRHRRARPRRRVRHRRHARHRAGRRRPLRSGPTSNASRPVEPDDIAYVAETVGIVRRRAGAARARPGFAGAPFTVASYLIEGARAALRAHQGADAHRRCCGTR